MPVGPGKYRVKTYPSGKKVRLHFTPSGKVNEAKSLHSSLSGMVRSGAFKKKRKK